MSEDDLFKLVKTGAPHLVALEFKKRHVDLESFRKMTDESLIEFGFTDYSLRRSLLRLIADAQETRIREVESIPFQLNREELAQMSLVPFDYPLDPDPILLPESSRRGLCLLHRAMQMRTEGGNYRTLMNLLSKALPVERRFFFSNLPYTQLRWHLENPLFADYIDQTVLTTAIEFDREFTVAMAANSDRLSVAIELDLSPEPYLDAFRAKTGIDAPSELVFGRSCLDALLSTSDEPLVGDLYAFTLHPIELPGQLYSIEPGLAVWKIGEAVFRLRYATVNSINELFAVYSIDVGLIVTQRRIVCLPSYHFARSNGLGTAPPVEIPDGGKPVRAVIPRKKGLVGQICYICHRQYAPKYVELNPALCLSCGSREERHLSESVDLTGRVAVVTGVRVKIGYATTLNLLRWGATVVGTTRFADAAREKYAKEPDAKKWLDRLELIEIDLRDIKAVMRMTDEILGRHPEIDILINNAAQTTRHPPAYYRKLLEKVPSTSDPATLVTTLKLTDGDTHPSQVVVLPDDEDDDPEKFPDGENRYGEPLDLREKTSWTMPIDEVPIAEALEVMLVNTTVPMHLIGAFRKAMSHERPAYIVNVTAKEGQFNVRNKPTTHVHTNIGKAGLNMITRTSADDLKRDRIYLNSVGTSFISNSTPGLLDSDTPLDPENGAARILWPVVIGERDREYPSGNYFIHYEKAPW